VNRLVTAFVLGSLALTSTAEAGKIDTLYSEWDGVDTVSPFGFGSLSGSYYAQTFVALPGLAQDLTFAMRDKTVGTVDRGFDLKFRVLLAETTGSPVLTGIGSILFESTTLSLSDGADFTTFTVNLGGIDLSDGQSYAWILDAYSDFELGKDGDSAAIAFNPSSAGVTGNEHFAFLNAENDGQTRSQHFDAGVWSGISSPLRSSMAFELTFNEFHENQPLPGNGDPTTNPNPVPEPSTLILFPLGLLGLALKRRNVDLCI